MEKLTQHKVGIVYDEYGEIIKTLVIKNNEDIDVVNKKKNLNDSQLKYINNKTQKSEFDKNLGGYIHMAYVKNELLFNELNLERSNISRLIYLATYLTYNSGEDEGLLVKRGQFNQIEPLKREDIFNMLNLSERAFISFLQEVKSCNLLYIKDKNFYLNTNYFNKGVCNFNNKEYTRIYINTTRELYKNCSVRNHKRLSYIFQLIPKLHYETNMLLHNPNVVDVSVSNKMSLKDICNFLKVSHEKGNGRKLLKELLKFNVKVDGSKIYLLKYITVEDSESKNDYFVVNPQVIWSGKDIDNIKNVLDKLFFNIV